MLASGFESAMLAAPGPGAADAALYDLGWGELLAAAPTLGAATAFAALGRTGSAAGILDDVLAVAFGFEPSLSTCVVLPRPHRADPPGQPPRRHPVRRRPRVSACRHCRQRHHRRRDGRRDRVRHRRRRPAYAVDATHGLDPGAAYRRVVVDLGPDAALGSHGDGPNEPSGHVGGGGRRRRAVALAHQLIAASRWMLDAARTHAIDRIQFGRSVASFQAVRHKLAESLVAIEGADPVAGACTDDVDPLLAAVAKSLAGKAARTSATHAQQVLAGIGFTTDHEFHLWLKRTLVVDTVFGSANSIPTEIGAELLARAPPPASSSCDPPRCDVDVPAPVQENSQRVRVRHPGRTSRSISTGGSLNDHARPAAELPDRRRTRRSGRSDTLAGRDARARRWPCLRRTDDRPNGGHRWRWAYPDQLVKSVDVVFPKGLATPANSSTG